MSATQLPETMDAILFKHPYKVAVEQVSTPKLQTEGDVIIKVHLAGLCGSDLHLYRAKEDAGKDYTMGHEVVGTIVQKGKEVNNFNVGDVVAVPFTISCVLLLLSLPYRPMHILSLVRYSFASGLPGQLCSCPPCGILSFTQAPTIA